MSCGPVPSELELAIVDAVSNESLGPGLMGNLLIGSPRVPATATSSCRPTETKKRRFSPRLARAMAPVRFFELAISGIREGPRALLSWVAARTSSFLSGRNVYPGHRALRASSAPGARGEHGRCLRNRRWTEGGLLVVIVEAPATCTTVAEVVHAVRAAVVRDHDVDVSVVGLVRPGELLRTWGPERGPDGRPASRRTRTEKCA